MVEETFIPCRYCTIKGAGKCPQCSFIVSVKILTSQTGLLERLVALVKVLALDPNGEKAPWEELRALVEKYASDGAK